MRAKAVTVHDEYDAREHALTYAATMQTSAEDIRP
jgi:hypothetical protein